MPRRARAARLDDVVPVGPSVVSSHVFALSADCCTSSVTVFPERTPKYGLQHRVGGCARGAPTHCYEVFRVLRSGPLFLGTTRHRPQGVEDALLVDPVVGVRAEEVTLALDEGSRQAR